MSDKLTLPGGPVTLDTYTDQDGKRVLLVTEGSVKPNNRPAPGPKGNTLGQVTPQTEPNLSGSTSKPPAKTESPKEKGYLEGVKEGIDDAIDNAVERAGFGTTAMVLGAIAKAVNEVFMPTAAWELIPVGKGAKILKKGGEAVGILKKTDEAADAAKETAETAAKKGAKSADNAAGGGYVKKSPEELAEAKKEQVKKNKRDGAKREQKTEDELKNQYPDASVQREQYLRDKDGNILKDPLTGEARRVDHVVIKDGKVIDMVETTSKSADKAAQISKENRILDAGGGYFRDRTTGKIVPVGQTPIRIIRRD